jgi:hypothetical protein
MSAAAPIAYSPSPIALEKISARTSSLEVASADPADTGRRLPEDLVQGPRSEVQSPKSDNFVPSVTFCENFPAETSSGFWEQEARAGSPVCGRMVPGEIPGPRVFDSHETPQPAAIVAAPVKARADDTLSASRALANPYVSEKQAKRAATRMRIWQDWQQLKAQGCTLEQAEKILGVSDSTLSRLDTAVAERGQDAFSDGYHNSGRKADLTLTPEEETRLQELYLKSNRTKDAGSMQTACKFFALAPETREEVRCAILWDLEHQRIPRFCTRALKKITAVHVGARRKPRMLATQHFAGSVGAFAQDKFERRRVVESDDGTLNFPAWIPWPQGGDPCSDKYGVRIGRWQFLPAIECGWSHYYLGYALVARPRGSYTQEDVRSVINMVVKQHGLPDEFRFERGTWESNSIVDLLKRLGVELETVFQSNQKPFIEGGFSPLWTYLSMIDGQVGRFRGEMETETKHLMKCQAGRAHPQNHFPSLEQCIKAIDGAMAMRNSDKINSIYGQWVPEVRHQQLAQERAWRQLPPDMDFLFAPWVKEWTVAKGTVGNMVRLLPDLETPCYFTHEELWRWNGRKVRVYFDPTQERVMATIVSLQDYAGYKSGDIICRAELFGALPHHARACAGWTSGPCAKTHASHRGPLSAVRREVRALAPNGQVKAASSEVRDGAGNGLKAEVGAAQPRGVESRSRVSEPAPTSRLIDEDDFESLS